MSGGKTLSEVNKNKIPVDYEYISNDPEENADNFDPKWAYFREMRTDDERFKALRKAWGSTEIPDPRINLTCSWTEVVKIYRHSKNQSESDTKENCLVQAPSENSEAKPAREQSSANRSRRNMKVSRRRSRSCTRPYEQLISNLEKNYQIEYSQLVLKHRAELQEMLLIQLQDSVTQMGNMINYGLHNHSFRNELTQNLQNHQEQQVNHLLNIQYNEWQHFMREKTENLDTCFRYMQEVKAFFTFYQKINDKEVTLQMTDEQYEHTLETDRMYSLYSNFYR